MYRYGREFISNGPSGVARNVIFGKGLGAQPPYFPKLVMNILVLAAFRQALIW